MKVKERLNARSTDILLELNKYLQLAQHARECLENSFDQGMGHKQDGLSELDIKGLSHLSIALDRIVTSKIKFDKHMKSFAEQMTPDEELAAIEEHVIGLEQDKRTTFLRKLIKRHNAMLNERGKKMGDEDVYEKS